MSVHAVFEVRIVPGAAPDAVERYEQYRAAVPALIERFGGRYLARAVTGEALEGPAPTEPTRWHLIEFPDAASAHAFWDSPEYRALAPLREGAAEVRAVLLGR
ncbi:MAG: DUF1330 domain-containing protein [Acidimicrobiia bacterium]